MEKRSIIRKDAIFSLLFQMYQKQNEMAHGYKIISQFIVSVSVLGKNASEARNKLYKSDRKFYARKCSRLANITDVFNRAVDSSDPLLSSLCLRELGKKKLLPKEVIDILQNPDVELNKSSYHSNKEKEVEVEDEFNCLYNKRRQLKNDNQLN